jgi:hypothetical protein
MAAQPGFGAVAGAISVTGRFGNVGQTSPRFIAATWWREALVVIAVVALASSGYLALTGYGFDLLEEGYFVSHARRVQLGAVPYRDLSVPYTPGVFYLYAWVMDWFGPGIVALRCLQVAARVVLYVTLYALGRQIMRPFFAAVPPMLLLAMDSAPELWSLHPGWFATAAALVSVLATARYCQTGRTSLLVWAGAACALSFAFKQNQGLYGLVATLWLLVVAHPWFPSFRHAARPTDDHSAGLDHAMRASDAGWPTQEPRWALRRITGASGFLQATALVLFALLPVVVTRGNVDGLSAAVLIAPPVAVSVVAAVVLRQTSAAWTTRPDRRDLPIVFARLLMALTGFGAVTLPWLTLLMHALEGRLDLLRSFIGDIDVAGYLLALQPLSLVGWLSTCALLLTPYALVGLLTCNRWAVRAGALGLGAAAGVILGATVAAIRAGHQVWGAATPAWSPYAGMGENGINPLYLYLPSLAFWSALTAWARRQAFAGPADQIGARPDLVRLWYLASGSALFLAQYPRMDAMHLAWSGGVLLVLGADRLSAWYQYLRRRWLRCEQSGLARGALLASLLALPATIALPYLAQRAQGLADLVSRGTLQRGVTEDVPAAYSALSLLPGAGHVWGPRDQVRQVQEVVQFIREWTAEGEPIFAYPALPGFYYLADRPNATRFNHLFHAMVSPSEQAEIVRQLDKVRYVIWDDEGARYWAHPGDNAAIVDYIRANFHVARSTGIYTILARGRGGPTLAD